MPDLNVPGDCEGLLIVNSRGNHCIKKLEVVACLDLARDRYMFGSRRLRSPMPECGGTVRSLVRLCTVF